VSGQNLGYPVREEHRQTGVRQIQARAQNRGGPEPGQVFRVFLSDLVDAVLRTILGGELLGQRASLLARVHASREGEYVNQFR
jgi:hypothetical protein